MTETVENDKKKNNSKNKNDYKIKSIKENDIKINASLVLLCCVVAELYSCYSCVVSRISCDKKNFKLFVNYLLETIVLFKNSI